MVFIKRIFFVIIYQISTSNSIENNWVIDDDFQPRETISLDGLWKFKLSPQNDQMAGFRDEWYKSQFKDYIDMPVPSSYNDVTTDRTVRDYLGWVWYQRTFKVPSSMQSNHLRLRFNSVHYYCKVWIDGYYIGEHEGGHIPFELPWPNELVPNRTVVRPKFTITLAVNNTLNQWTIPQGKVVHQDNPARYPAGYVTYSHDFDYFDYAGINGRVFVYSYRELIENIYLHTAYYNNGTGTLKYNVTRKLNTTLCLIKLRDHLDNVVSTTHDCVGQISVSNVTAWWPANCGKTPVGYLYKFQAQLGVKRSKVIAVMDSSEKHIGFRTITFNKMSLFVNNVPVYLQGFGMHQDAEIRGRGFDWVQTTRDLNLLQWIGANAVRTSHYPYPHEFVDFADRRGIMIIFESPACSLSIFDEKLLARHKQVISEMYQEFAYHPSIIMWSLANEPDTSKIVSESYFDRLINHTRSLDSTRPITIVTSQLVANEKAIQHADIICLNRYSGWYNDGGTLELIKYQTVNELKQWFDKFQKPLIFTEYGAGAVSGLHTLPSAMWSENYHVELFHEHFQAFDIIKDLGFLVGEMVWNFADFNTPQEYIRPGACVKGVFTRNRQPKAAAYTLKKRYETLASNCGKKCDIPLAKKMYDDKEFF